jgi:tetratricopeptide (TPR) repeat protein
MPEIRIVLLVIAFTFLSSGLVCAQQKSYDPIDQKFEKKIEKVETSVNWEVKRLNDELQSTRGLIKDTYSSWIQTVQFVIALFLGLVTVLVAIAGVAGWRNISKLQSDHEAELKEIVKIKRKMRRDSKQITDEYERIRQKNESQDERLDQFGAILDMWLLMRQGDSARALKFAERAVTRYPRSATIWYRKGLLHSALRQHEEALTAYKQVLDIDPTHKIALANLLEATLFLNRTILYQDLLQRFRHEIEEFDQEQHGLFCQYLEILKAYMDGNFSAMRESMRSTLDNLGAGRVLVPIEWYFGDLQTFLTTKSSSLEKDLLLSFVEVIQGSKPAEDLLARLSEANETK